jgi:hypothetical protein
MYRAYDNWQFDSGRRPEPARQPEPSGPEWGSGSSNPLRTLVHPLVFCPPLARGTQYQLVRRSWPGMRTVLAEGRAPYMQQALNLALVRRAAATIGANEVHVLS